MDSKGRTGTVFNPTGNPETMNITPDYAPGELGTTWNFNQKQYQLIQVDSGATAATPTGVVATNQIAFWKDRTAYLVTNDRRFAEGGQATQSYQNKVAGRFTMANTAGYYGNIQQKGIGNLLDGGNSFAVGEFVFAENDNAAAADRVGVGTATSYQNIGTARGGASGGVVSVDLNIPSVP